jgi:hypothetical protein
LVFPAGLLHSNKRHTQRKNRAIGTISLPQFAGGVSLAAGIAGQNLSPETRFAFC